MLSRRKKQKLAIVISFEIAVMNFTHFFKVSLKNPQITVQA